MTEFMTLPAELRLFRDRAHAVEVLRLVVAGLSEHEVTLWIDPHSDETLSGAAVAAQSHLEQRMSETKGQVTWWRRLGESTPRLSGSDPLDVEAFCCFAYCSIAAEIRVFDWLRHSSVFDMNDTGTSGSYQLPVALYASVEPALSRLGLPAWWPRLGDDGGDSQSPGD